MKPQRFEIGQAVSLKNTSEYRTDNTIIGSVRGSYPKVGEILTVKSYYTIMFGTWFITFSVEDDNDAFDEDDFEPVATSAAITELLEESLKTETV